MDSSVVSSTVTCPCNRTAVWAAARKRPSVRADGSLRLSSTDLEAAKVDADERFADFVFGERPRSGPPRTGLLPWGDSGSRSGSRRIIVLRAAFCAAPVHIRFYAKCAFTAVSA